MNYEFFGFLAVLILIAGLGFVVWRWPHGKHKTFSQHVAWHKSATLYYFALFAVALPILDLFFVKWFVPTFNINGWFNVFVLTSSAFQIACTLIPETVGWRVRLHQLFAGLSAVLLLPALGLVVTSQHVTTASRVISAATLAIMLGIIGLVKLVRGKHSHLLIFQSAFFVAFFITILYISYATKPVLMLTSWENENLQIYE
jgi:hypothetical protein